MDLQEVTESQKREYNTTVTHIMQSWQWGEFRKKLGLPLLRFAIFKNGKIAKAFQLTLHKIPFTNKFVGYLPKGPLPDKELALSLEIIGKKYNCAFIKVEPNIEDDNSLYKIYPKFIPSPKTLFTRYNFVIDLTKSEEELLKAMHPKTRYNIRLAQKKGVKVEVRTDDKAFDIYQKLYFQTTKRQGYHGHNTDYHQKVWQTLKQSDMARILIGFYNKKPLTAWLLVNFKDTLYYPYGGSSNEHRELMHSNLVAWEAIRLGKKLNLKQFDMWGALGPKANPNDPWMGFHRFKQGYGGKLVRYIGTYDLIFDDPLYWAFTIIDRLTTLKVFLLKLIGK